MQEDRIKLTVFELRGLSADDIETISDALCRFVEFYIQLFQTGGTALIPFDTMLNSYLHYCRYKAFPKKQQVLEIGAGCAYLPFFEAGQPSMGCYNLIETTQSFYLLQNKVASFCYGPDFQDRAVDFPSGGNAGELEPEVHRLELPWEPRACLFPWWRVGDAFSKNFDLVLSHANLCEMTDEARDYYLRSVHNSLNSGGYFYVRDLGLAGEEGKRPKIVQQILDQGFRARVVVGRPDAKAWVCSASLLFIKDGHPDFDTTPEGYETVRLPTDDPIVQGMFFMNKVPQPVREEADIVRTILDNLRSKL